MNHDYEFRDNGLRGSCPICGETFECQSRLNGLRDGLINHIENKHNNPESILYGTAYINKLEKDLEEKLCLYCKTFENVNSVLINVKLSPDDIRFIEFEDQFGDSYTTVEIPYMCERCKHISYFGKR